MSRMRQTMRSSTNPTVRGSRMMGTSFGYGRDSRNYQVRPSPRISGKFETPEKIQGSSKKFYSHKKITEFDPR